MKFFALWALLATASAGAQTLDFTSGPISSVQPISSAFAAFPAAGDEVYGVISLGTVVATSGSSTTYDASGDFGIVPASALHLSGFVPGTGQFAAPDFSGQITLDLLNGQIASFSFSLSEPGASVSASSASSGAEADSAGGGFRAFSPAGSVYSPAPPPAGYSCFNLTTPWACEAQNGETSLTYFFYSPPAGAPPAPEIDASGATGALTLLGGVVLMLRGRRRAA